MSNTRRWLLAAATVYAGSLFVETAAAYPNFVQKLKDLGYPVVNCQYCHLDNSPKKDKPHGVNDRGRWLWSEKQRRGVRTIDPSWLKDYPGGKEQK